jgi:methyl-accepting chemotaxis protein
MNKLLSSVLGRLRLWQKLAILGGITVLLVTIPSYVFYKNEQQVIKVALQEQQGLEPAVKILDVLRAVAKHRSLSASVLAGKESLEADRRKQKAQVEQAMEAFEAAAKLVPYPGLMEQWAKFKEGWVKTAQGLDSHSLNREQSWNSHTQLNSQALNIVRNITANSLMDLDPDAGSYYLIQAILSNSATLGEKLGQAHGFGASLLVKAEEQRAQGKPPGNPRDLQDRAMLYAMAERAGEAFADIKYHLGQFQAAEPASMQQHLVAPAQQMEQLVEKVLPLARNEIVEANALSYSSSDYFANFSKAIDATFALADAGSATLKDLLAQKVKSARSAQLKTLALTTLMFLITALIAVLVASSITGPVRHLVGVMDKLTMGDDTVRAGLETQDEIGTLGRQFDIMLDQREAAAEKVRVENEHLNNSVIVLLQAVARLAEKDLTAKVPVAEDLTGLVADALNLLTQETANVLNRVVDIAGKVAEISRQVKAQSDLVIDVASEEKHEVEQAAAELSHASAVMQDIAQLALSCNEAAEQAIQNTNRAQETVLGTVEGITTIRDTIRETEKRIKRLGERSQEIGSVVTLINGIAERTHILAINASMHAASAGEAGRGFAVVANEVQKLAENAREATLKISGLVNNIQLETADTVTTMNDAISQVVRGTTLAQEAGKEMRETRDTTANLVQLVRRIADSSKAQAETSLQLRERALQIQNSTEHTYEQLQAQGMQTTRLLSFSEDLVESVGVFTLPRATTA